MVREVLWCGAGGGGGGEEEEEEWDVHHGSRDGLRKKSKESLF